MSHIGFTLNRRKTIQHIEFLNSAACRSFCGLSTVKKDFSHEPFGTYAVMCKNCLRQADKLQDEIEGIKQELRKKIK